MAVPVFFSARFVLLDFEMKPSGFDEFDFKVGGLLLFLNTFGTEIIAALALPLAAAAVTPISGAGQDSRDSISPPSAPLGGTASSSPTPFGSMREEYRHPARSSPSPWDAADAAGAGAGGVLSAMERLSALTLLLSSFRTFLSAANVSVQRGHLMLWAVFAPKFVFDATMQAVCGAAAVLAWGVVLLAYRAHFPAAGPPGTAWRSSAAVGYGGGRGSLPARKKAR